MLQKMNGLKTHGIPTLVDGEVQDGDRLGLVDDLITTATTKLEAVDSVKEDLTRRGVSCAVTGVYVVLDR